MLIITAWPCSHFSHVKPLYVFGLFHLVGTFYPKQLTSEVDKLVKAVYLEYSEMFPEYEQEQM